MDSSNNVSLLELPYLNEPKAEPTPPPPNVAPASPPPNLVQQALIDFLQSPAGQGAAFQLGSMSDAVAQSPMSQNWVTDPQAFNEAWEADATPEPAKSALKAMTVAGNVGESLFANGLNQLNRIGGNSEEVPWYDRQVTIEDAFLNSGQYTADEAAYLGLAGAMLAPGMGEFAAATDLLKSGKLVAPLLKLSNEAKALEGGEEAAAKILKLANQSPVPLTNPYTNQRIVAYRVEGKKGYGPYEGSEKLDDTFNPNTRYYSTNPNYVTVAHGFAGPQRAEKVSELVPDARYIETGVSVIPDRTFYGLPQDGVANSPTSTNNLFASIEAKLYNGTDFRDLESFRRRTKNPNATLDDMPTLEQYQQEFAQLKEGYQAGTVGGQDVVKFINHTFRYGQDEVYKNAGIDVVLSVAEEGKSKIVDVYVDALGHQLTEAQVNQRISGEVREPFYLQARPEQDRYGNEIMEIQIINDSVMQNVNIMTTEEMMGLYLPRWMEKEEELPTQ